MKKFLICLFVSLFFSLTFADVTPDFNRLGRIPVLHNGRVKPLDTVARFALINLQEKQSIQRGSESLTPTQWLLDVFCLSDDADSDKVFKIVFEDLIYELGLDVKEKYFSYAELSKHYDFLNEKYQTIVELESQERSVYQRSVFQLFNKMNLYMSLKYAFLPYDDYRFSDYIQDYRQSINVGLESFNLYNQNKTLTNDQYTALYKFNAYFKFHQRLTSLSSLYFYPDPYQYSMIDIWTNTGTELLVLLDPDREPHQLMDLYATVMDAYIDQDYVVFNDATNRLFEYHQSSSSSLWNRVSIEYFYNILNPLGNTIILYIVVFLLSFVYFLYKKEWLFKSSYYLVMFCFFIHTISLLARMYISQRPPVTNLYSSAVFVGWFAILLSLIQERFFKNKLGPFLASILGFLSLIVAYHLSFQSDTFELMQAVLDSNFWLTTHVITVTLGYSGTFLAGFIGFIYVFKMIFMSPSNKDILSLSKMVFGIVCFSLLFSFIGTVLGGIWADQSWGRFWGWDPKENGALLIVLWNALILHARMAGIIRVKGLMLSVIFGNVITAFSWFGVNMLGVGLHSYGFMEKEFWWLVGFCGIHFLIICISSAIIKPMK